MRVRRGVKLLLAALVLVAILDAWAVRRVFPIPSGGERCTAIAGWSDRGPQGAPLDHPMGLAWSGERLYVADPGSRSVKVFRSDGSLAATWGGFRRPLAVAAVDTLVVVADYLADRITQLDRRGEVVRRWGGRGREPGRFDGPSAVAVDDRGHVFVADFYNHRIQEFSADGRFLRQWGRDGRRSGRFHYPTGLAVNPRGEILVADGFNHRIQRFTIRGEHLDQWGGIGFGLPGKWPGWFRLARDVAVDARGNVYAADAFNGRVQKFTSAGRLLALWGAPGGGGQPADRDRIHYPAGLAAAPDGSVYVSDFFEGRIWKLVCR